MAKLPTYKPDCQARLCFNYRTRQVQPASQYVYDGRLRHVCGACANKIGKALGLNKPKPKKKQPPSIELPL